MTEDKHPPPLPEKVAADQVKDQLQLKKVFNLKLIRRGLLLFAAITLVTITGIFLYTNSGETLKIWSTIEPIYLLAGGLFIANDLYLGGLRNHIFIREFLPGISQMVSIRANLANIFMGAVTPSQSGGGPAQWYVLYRNGISIPDVLGTSFYNWISTLIFFPLTGAMAIFILQDKIPPGFTLHLTQFGFYVFTTLLAVVLIGLFAPRFIHSFIRIVARVLAWGSKKVGQSVEVAGTKALNNLNEYRLRYLGLIKEKPQLMLMSFGLTIMLYFNKYILAYVIVLAFGLDVDFWTVIAIQAVVYLLLYFAPSPGGSGIAELSISALMAGVIGTAYVASFTLLFRSFMVYIPALIGAGVVLKQLSKE